ncbi:MAG: hypothetical protein NT074_04820 [Methanomicrobiales archaeon]|nr:hypothetical protein [Methanomicrobiales archaeon]
MFRYIEYVRIRVAEFTVISLHYRARTRRDEGALLLALIVQEPDEPDGEWEVRYLIRPENDPSLLIPADLIWQGKIAGYSSLPPPAGT